VIAKLIERALSALLLGRLAPGGAVSQPSWIRWVLPVIILIYLILGILYAVYTPAWQAPDEPAHYNYVRFLAEHHRFPILKLGDYPADYLEEIKAARFPPEMSIDPIRYEFHQPPLYYLLAVPVYRLFGGALLPLRFLSVAMGALLLLVVHWTVHVLAPARPYLALGAMAFVAFLPMHLAMTAAANNDALAELLLGTVILLSLRYLKLDDSRSGSRERTRLLILLGVTTGLALVTKSSIYVALPLVLLAIALKHYWLEDRTLAAGLKSCFVYLMPAVVLALPWWLRNIALYGNADFLGLGRHDQVVAGQLRTAEFITEYGSAQLVRDFALTSFRSFWGQFGWMGVLLDERLYQALAILSALAVLGFAFWAARLWRRRGAFPKWQRAAGGLLLASGLLTLVSYFWYNAQFVQHQGRYLFPALVPIGLAVALGWREALGRDLAWPLAALFLLGAAVLWLAGVLPNWPLLMLIATAGALAVRRFLPGQLDPFIHACPYVLLILVDLASLFLFIVPQLMV
jgi:4-amino-4-deoxy-L-arabinose transferase-like glycosyltransferase